MNKQSPTKKPTADRKCKQKQEIKEAERRGAKKCIDSIIEVHDMLINKAFPKGEYDYGHIFLKLMELARKFKIRYKEYEPIPSKLNKLLKK